MANMSFVFDVFIQWQIIPTITNHMIKTFFSGGSFKQCSLDTEVSTSNSLLIFLEIQCSRKYSAQALVISIVFGGLQRPHLVVLLASARTRSCTEQCTQYIVLGIESWSGIYNRVVSSHFFSFFGVGFVIGVGKGLDYTSWC